MDEVKSFRFVHATSEDFWTIVKEVIDGLDDRPRAHGWGDSILVCELHIVETKDVAEEADHDPIR